MANKKPTFEQAMGRLNEIVRTLEKGDSPLNESLALFEEGAGLVSACQKELDEAEQKVVKLRKGADGQPEETPFTDAEL
jgi:exodeoxyribonuclease VII small subunit